MQLNISINDYTYNLPDERIAKFPLERRDESQLLVYNQGIISKNTFYNLSDFIPSDSLLVYNDTKVIPARLFFTKESGALIEIFCLEPANNLSHELALSTSKSVQWKCLTGNLKKWKEGKLTLTMKDGILTAEKILVTDEYQIIEFTWSHANYTFANILEQVGKIPIPPYLKRDDEEIDKTRYQTIFSNIKGSVAAPTAGLHITPVIFEKLEVKGIQHTHVTLHVGAGTFKPVKTEQVSDHIMHFETFHIDVEDLKTILSHLGNITALGTTTLRTLESLYWLGVKLIQTKRFENTLLQWETYDLPSHHSPKEVIETLYNYLKNNNLKQIIARTQILIVPGYQFKMVNRLITNFHQPQSTLLLLVAAFIGDKWREVYDYAMGNNFRFLSYGDGSLLIPYEKKTIDNGQKTIDNGQKTIDNGQKTIDN